MRFGKKERMGKSMIMGGKKNKGERKMNQTGREKTWREKAGKMIKREGVRK